MELSKLSTLRVLLLHNNSLSGESAAVADFNYTGGRYDLYRELHIHNNLALIYKEERFFQLTILRPQNTQNKNKTHPTYIYSTRYGITPTRGCPVEAEGMCMNSTPLGISYVLYRSGRRDIYMDSIRYGITVTGCCTAVTHGKFANGGGYRCRLWNSIPYMVGGLPQSYRSRRERLTTDNITDIAGTGFRTKSML